LSTTLSGSRRWIELFAFAMVSFLKFNHYFIGNHVKRAIYLYIPCKTLSMNHCTLKKV
jgi:hypothetical protein